MPTSWLRKQSQFKAKSFGLVANFLLLLSSGVCLCDSEAGESKYGDLLIEGKYIERLVLRPRGGAAEIFHDPNETIRLPVGEYRVIEVRLKGGYRRETIANSGPVVISGNAPAMLKVGGPLKHTVNVVR